MIWIIVVSVLVVAVAIAFASKRTRVLRSKEKLQEDVLGALDSFESLKAKVNASDLRDHQKARLVGNIDMNITTLERWKATAIPNITFWKNHPEPIQKELVDLREGVARDLAAYDGLKVD